MKISCLIAARDVEQYIEQCIASCIPQFDEVLCYDHNSTDATREIVKSLLPPENLILDSTSTHSLPQIRELLTLVSSHSYIVLQDADDYRLPGTVRIHKQELLESGADLLVTPYQNEHGRLTHQSHDFITDLVSDTIHPSCVYIRKELIRDFPDRLSCEYWMLYDIYRTHSPTVTYSDVVAVTHRQHSNPKALHRSKLQEIQKSRLELCETILGQEKLTAMQYNLISQTRNSYQYALI